MGGWGQWPATVPLGNLSSTRADFLSQEAGAQQRKDIDTVGPFSDDKSDSEALVRSYYSGIMMGPAACTGGGCNSSKSKQRGVLCSGTSGKGLPTPHFTDSQMKLKMRR